MNLPRLVRLVASVALCLMAGLLGSTITKTEIPLWYNDLVKPFWTPSAIAFPIVWTTLYVLMGFSLWRLWDLVPPSRERRRALVLFFVQFSLNALWTPVFFGLHSVVGGMAVIVLLLFAVSYAIMAINRVDRIASWLLVPYLAWIIYASTINAGVVALN